MWYTSPWFIIGCVLLLIIVFFFLWTFWFAKQLCKLIDVFYMKLIEAIPADRSSFNFNMEFNDADHKIVRYICKLDSAADMAQPNKISTELSGLLEAPIDGTTELQNYNVLFNVEVLKSRLIFRASCESKLQLEGVE